MRVVALCDQPTARRIVSYLSALSGRLTRGQERTRRSHGEEHGHSQHRNFLTMQAERRGGSCRMRVMPKGCQGTRGRDAHNIGAVGRNPENHTPPAIPRRGCSLYSRIFEVGTAIPGKTVGGSKGAPETKRIAAFRNRRAYQNCRSPSEGPIRSRRMHSREMGRRELLKYPPATPVGHSQCRCSKPLPKARRDRHWMDRYFRTDQRSKTGKLRPVARVASGGASQRIAFAIEENTCS